MKKHLFFSIILCCFFAVTVSAKQDKYIKHTVVQGETIQQIAQKYKVTPFDIYKLNPDSQNGLKADTVLLIPSTTVINNSKPTSSASTQSVKIHVVEPKETLFSLSRQYGVSVDAIKEANQELLVNGLQIGQRITIPNSSGSEISTTVTKNEIPKVEPTPVKVPTPVIAPTKASTSSTQYHIVQPKETKFGISKMYGMTIEELERMNPQIVDSFPIGMKLVVSGSSNSMISPVANINTTNSTSSSTKIYLEEYVVRPNETIFSIARDYGMNEAELISYNPELKKGLKLGMILRVPKGKRMEVIKKEKVDLQKSLNSSTKKNLVMLLPFNVTKIQKDSVISTEARLAKDKFLNITLDFYAGALIAIDSAKTLGLNVDVKIFDSQETKNSSSLGELVQNHSLENADAIIGPFYQSNIDKLLEWIGPTKTPVISPLSKETGKKFPNVYQTITSDDRVKNTMFDFMRSKEGNIVAVIDSKKQSIYDYYTKNQPDVKIIGLSEKGTLVMDSLVAKLKKNKPNYVILSTEKTNMILNTTNILQKLKQDYQIQLAVLEYNETLDFEEVSIQKLAALNMMYPSMLKPSERKEYATFENNYRKINNILPNQYAIRGFDVTFDAMLRLSQKIPFEETVKTSITEYVDTKFDYIQTENGYQNTGAYVLYYDNDLTIKEAQ